MDNFNVIAIKDVLDETTEECFWEDFVTDNLESGSQFFEELTATL